MVTAIRRSTQTESESEEQGSDCDTERNPPKRKWKRNKRHEARKQNIQKQKPKNLKRLKNNFK